MATVPGVFTFSAGSVLTAAQLNTYLTGATSFLLAPPLYVGQQTVQQAITSGVWTAVSLDLEIIDRDGGHTSANPTRYTSQTQGWYDLDITCGFAGNTSGTRAVAVSVNGTGNRSRKQQGVTDTAGSLDWVATTSGKIFLNVGDYTEIAVFQNAGSLTTASGSAEDAAYMQIEWIST